MRTWQTRSMGFASSSASASPKTLATTHAGARTPGTSPRRAVRTRVILALQGREEVTGGRSGNRAFGYPASVTK